MAVATNIVLADAQATPVNHTFVPQGRDKDGFYYYEDQSSTNPLGWWKVGLHVSKPIVSKPGATASGQPARVKVKLLLPVLESLSTADSGLTPAPVIAYIPAFHGEFVMSLRGVKLDRQNVRKMAYNLMNNPQVVAAVEDLTDVTG